MLLIPVNYEKQELRSCLLYTSLSQGYEKNVVVCTRHPGYRKEHNKLMPLLRLKFREYPELVKLLDERHIQYNRMLDKIAYLEKEGRIHVIRPDRDISAKPVERDPAHLKAVSYTHLDVYKRQLLYHRTMCTERLYLKYILG